MPPRCSFPEDRARRGAGAQQEAAVRRRDGVHPAAWAALAPAGSCRARGRAAGGSDATGAGAELGKGLLVEAARFLGRQQLISVRGSPRSGSPGAEPRSGPGHRHRGPGAVAGAQTGQPEGRLLGGGPSRPAWRSRSPPAASPGAGACREGNPAQETVSFPWREARTKCWPSVNWFLFMSYAR